MDGNGQEGIVVELEIRQRDEGRLGKTKLDLHVSADSLVCNGQDGRGGGIRMPVRLSSPRDVHRCLWLLKRHEEEEEEEEDWNWQIQVQLPSSLMKSPRLRFSPGSFHDRLILFSRQP